MSISERSSAHKRSIDMGLVEQYDIISDLRTTLSGRVITPDDAQYDAARTVFYGGIDRRPLLIARAANAADVARVIALARERRWRSTPNDAPPGLRRA
jgi:hypothetical protein